MAFGLNSLNVTLNDIKSYIKKLFTEELIQQLKLTAIAAQELMEAINSSDFIDCLQLTINSINANDLSRKVGLSISEVNQLINKFNQTDIIQKLDRLLERVHTYDDLMGIDMFLKNYGKIIPYAVIAGTVFSAFLPIALQYAADRSKDAFQKKCLERLDILAGLQFTNTKFAAGSFLTQFNMTSCRGELCTADRKRLAALAEEARNFIDYTPSIDMSILHTYAAKIFQDIYVQADTIMDGVSIELTAEHIKYATLRQFKKMNYSNNAFALNHAMVKHLYGEKIIDKLISDLSVQFSLHGLVEIYNFTVTRHDREKIKDQDYSERVWSACGSLNTEALYAHEKKLKIFMQEGGPNFIKKRIDGILSDDVVKVIMNRALLERCYLDGKYFCFPWNAKLQIVDGFYDSAELNPARMAHGIKRTYSTQYLRGSTNYFSWAIPLPWALNIASYDPKTRSSIFRRPKI